MRKPIEHELKALQTPRERMWAAMLKLHTGFTVWSVQDTAVPLVGFDATRDYIRELVKAGYVCQVAGSESKHGNGNLKTRPVFDLVKPQFEPPQLTSSRQGLGVLAMWRAMKVMSAGFNLKALVAAASMPGVMTVTVGTAKSYVAALTRAGYLVPLSPPKPGHATHWRLVRNTGPHAPAITRRKTVFDRNTGEFAGIETAQEVCDGLN